MVAESLAEMLQRTWFVSSDCHVAEPPDLWQSRVDVSRRDRAPRVVAEHDGDWWYVDGHRTASFTMAQAGKRFDKEANPLRFSGVFEDVSPTAYDPSRYIEANETDGVWGSVVYPSEGLMLFYVPNTEVVDAATHAYNDWLAEFCSEDPKRLKGVAMVNVDDPDDGGVGVGTVRAAAARRCAHHGRAACMDAFREPRYDRLWAAACDLRMPLSLHVASDRADPAQHQLHAGRPATRPSVFVNSDHQVREALAELILSGVFERFPNSASDQSSMASGGSRSSWSRWTSCTGNGRVVSTGTATPTRERCRAISSDATCSRASRRTASVYSSATLIGTENMTWGSDFPHGESTFPRSREILAEVLDGVATGDARRIVSENAAELYGFEVPIV